MGDTCALRAVARTGTPREDLREGKPLDASEFAVHLDDVRNGSAPADYQKPERFFARTAFPHLRKMQLDHNLLFYSQWATET